MTAKKKADLLGSVGTATKLLNFLYPDPDPPISNRNNCTGIKSGLLKGTSKVAEYRTDLYLLYPGPDPDPSFAKVSDPDT